MGMSKDNYLLSASERAEISTAWIKLMSTELVEKKFNEYMASLMNKESKK